MGWDLELGDGCQVSNCATMQMAVLSSARKTSGVGRANHVVESLRDSIGSFGETAPRVLGPVSGEFGDLSSPAPFFLRQLHLLVCDWARADGGQSLILCGVVIDVASADQAFRLPAQYLHPRPVNPLGRPNLDRI